jgi:hypothetical protein
VSKVINVDFNQNEGYIMDNAYPNSLKIDGVYVGKLAGLVGDNGNCMVGLKADDSVTGQEMKVSELNRFCLMWLAVFDPDVLKEEE